MKTKLICTVGAMMLGAAALALGGFKDMNAFVEAESQNEIHAGDGSVSFHEPPGPASVTVTPRDGWRFTDGSTSKTIVHNPGETNVIHMASREGEQDKDLTIVDDWRHTHDCARGVAHDHAPEIKAGEADIKPIALYAAPALGTPAVTNIDWETVVKGAHVSSNAMVTVCRFPGCGFKCDPDAEIIEIEPEPLEEACTLVGGVVGKDGVLYLPKGSYDYMLTADWKSETCDECACGSYTNVHVDVYEALLECEEYIGLDMTDEGRNNQQRKTATVRTEEPYPAGCFGTDWIPGELCRTVGENLEPDAIIFTPKTNNVASARMNDQIFRATVGLNGSEAGATCTNSFTVVKVDVKIKGVEEEDEETLGAFVHYEDDHGVKPFTPRGTNMLEDVEFSYEPKDLPLTQTVKLTFPDETLYERHVVGGVTNFVPAREVYTIEAIATNRFVLHGHTASGSLRDFAITIEHPISGAKDKAKFTAVEMDLVPDFSRDGKIDKEDEKSVVYGKTFYWWRNDDADEGDCASCYADIGSEIPNTDKNGLQQNWKDDKVNGRTDLLDFFPLRTIIGTAEKMFRAEKDCPLSIQLVANNIGYVQTRLTKDRANEYLTKDSESVRESILWFNSDLCDAKVRTGGSARLNKYYEELCALDPENAGVLMIEGRGISKHPDVALELLGPSGVLLRVPFKCVIKDVMKMMNLAEIDERGNVKWVSKMEDEKELVTKKVDIFSLHGFKVSKDFAKGWHSEFFKRLHQSGCEARFNGIIWSGYMGDDGYPGLHYHECAYRGLVSGDGLKNWMDENEGSFHPKRIFLAHSLGNMVVSSAIKEGMKCDIYFMLNAAVPSEAYNGELSFPEKQRQPESQYLVHRYWGWQTHEERYPFEAYCSEWYKLFERDTDEASKSRAKLTWKNYFRSVVDKENGGPTVYNLHSDGDEVFEISKEKNFWMGEGWKFRPLIPSEAPNLTKRIIDKIDLSQYCWQKQEIAKGVMSQQNRMEKSDMAGWGFNGTKGPYVGEVPKEERSYNWSQAQQVARDRKENFKTIPVFRNYPREVFGENKTVLSKDKIREMLACAIPAVSKPMGTTSAEIEGVEFWNVTTFKNDENSWGRKAYAGRWLHCDIKDMAYFYTSRLWDRIVDKGGLK